MRVVAIQPDVPIAEDDYDSIFLVVLPSPGPTLVFRLQYGATGSGAGKGP